MRGLTTRPAFGTRVASGYPNVLTELAIVAGTFGYRSSASLGDMGLPLRGARTKEN
jgi:hypothetical protein